MLIMIIRWCPIREKRGEGGEGGGRKRRETKQTKQSVVYFAEKQWKTDRVICIRRGRKTTMCSTGTVSVTPSRFAVTRRINIRPPPPTPPTPPTPPSLPLLFLSFPMVYSHLFLYYFSLFFSFISRCFHSPPPSFDPCFSGRDHSPFPSRSESNDEEKMERINDNNPATSAEDEMPELIAGSYQMVQSISIIQSLGQN